MDEVAERNEETNRFASTFLRQEPALMASGPRKALYTLDHKHNNQFSSCQREKLAAHHSLSASKYLSKIVPASESTIILAEFIHEPSSCSTYHAFVACSHS